MRLAITLLLAWFAFFGLVAGGWQQFAPESFYADFPGLGHHWVSPDGPYNEHLLRDVGQGNLAFGTVALVALLTGGIWLARATGLAAVVAGVPHQIYRRRRPGLSCCVAAMPGRTATRRPRAERLDGLVRHRAAQPVTRCERPQVLWTRARPARQLRPQSPK